MENHEIGLVGLLLGKEHAALHYSVSEAEATECMTAVSSGDSPALVFIKRSLLRSANDDGHLNIEGQLALPQKALQLIKDSIYSDSEDAQEDAKESAASEQRATDSAKPPDSSNPHNGDAPKIRIEKETFSEDGVVQKAVDMYDKGIKPKIISSLYNVPVGVVHCWGDWRQMSPDKAAEMRLKQATVMELREAGVSETEICRRLRVSINMLVYITGEYSPQPMYRSGQKSKYAAYCRLVRDCGKASIELGVPVKRLRKFMTDQESDFETIQSDVDADKQTKINVLETFYTTGMDISETAQIHGLSDSKLVATWVGEFMRSFRRPKHRRKAAGMGNPYKICNWISELEKSLWQEATQEAMRSKALI